MKNNQKKGSTLTQIITAIVFTLIVIGGIGYYWFNSRMEEHKYKIKELEEIRKQSTIPINLNNNCYKTYTNAQIDNITASFEYPCTWSVKTTEKQYAVTSADSKAIFYFPAVDLNLSGTEIIEESTIKIMDKNYPTKKYKDNDITITLIETEISENKYNLMTIYENPFHTSKLNRILSTFKF